MEIHLGIAVILNFFVELLLLLGTNRLCGCSGNRRRILLSALVGALHSGLCLLPEGSFLGSLPWRLVNLGIMGLIAFGWSLGALRCIAMFLLLTMALGGFAASLGSENLPSQLLAALGMWLLCRAVFQTEPGQTCIPVSIGYGDIRLELNALRDTGNCLRDPITGEPVLIIGPKAAQQLTGLVLDQLRNPVDAITQAQLPGLRLIPYHTISQEGGMLLAMRFADVKIGSERRSTLVAFAPRGIGEGAKYQALTGGAL